MCICINICIYIYIHMNAICLDIFTKLTCIYVCVYIYIIIIHIIPLDLRERVNTSTKLFGPKQYSRRTHCQGRGWWWGQDFLQLLQPSHACRPQQVCTCTIPSLRESGGSGYSVQFNKFLSSPFPPFPPFPNSTTDALL